MSVSMDVEPSRVTFNDVHINQTYTNSLTITNPLEAQVQFELVPSTSRITVNPTTVTLRGGQSLIVTVRLTLNHYPKQSGHIQLKSSFFNQIIPVDYGLSSMLPSHKTAGSPSPSSRNIASAIKKERRDVLQSEGATVREYSDISRMKDAKIAELQNLVRQLQTKDPSLRDVIPLYEDYEEKIHSVLRFAKGKDAEIAELTAKLNEANSLVKDLKDVAAQEKRESIIYKHRNYYTQRVDEPGLNFELEYDRLLIENEQLKKSLAAAKEPSPVEEAAHQSLVFQHQNELYHLRERNTELVEDRKVRQREFVDLKTELDKVKNELESTKQDRDRLTSLNNQIRRSHEELQQKLLLADQDTSRLKKENEILAQQRKQGSRVSFDRNNQNHDDSNDMLFEPEVGGGVGMMRTVTPTYFGLHNKENLVQTLNEKDSRAQRLQENLERCARELESVKGRLAESGSVESSLRERNAALEKRLSDVDHENQVLYERVERMRSMEEGTQFALQDKEVQLQAALDKAVEKASTNTVSDAHVWWSYVWHETRKAAQQNKLVPGDLNFNPYASPTSGVGAASGGSGVGGDVQVNIHLQRMKDNIRDHVIEIANLRQQLLGHQLSSKKDLDSLRSQLQLADREVVRLKQSAHIHQGHKDVLITQKDARIRVLSSNASDVHMKLNEALAELEIEKLTNHQLRADVDKYQRFHETDKALLQERDKARLSLQQTIDSMAVYQTVMNIPGVEPATLIEMMSGQLNQLRSELSKTKQSLSETTGQVKSLQHAATLNGQRLKNGSDAAAAKAASGGVQNTPSGTPGATTFDRRSRLSSRSPSPSSRSNNNNNNPSSKYDALLSKMRTRPLSVSKPNRRSSMTALDDTILDEDDLEGVMHQSSLASPTRQSFDPTVGFTVDVNSETTPDVLLDKLDSAMLIQRIHTQDSTITELRARVEDLTENGLSNTKELMLERDVTDYGDRLELDAALRRYELLQTQHDEAKQEIAMLKERMIGLDKALADKNIDDFLTRINGSVAASVAAPTEHNVVDDELPLLGRQNVSDVSTVISEGNAGGAFNGLNPQVDSGTMLDELMKQLASKDSQLKATATQLKVVRETLDSLQTAGVAAFDTPSDENILDEDAYLFAPKSTQRRAAAARSSHVDNAYDSMGLADLANMADLSPSGGAGAGRGGRVSESSAGVQALITRVVQLTSELAAQCTATAVQERTAVDLEHSNRKKSKELNQYKSTVKTLDEQLSAARLSLMSFTNQLKDQEKQYVENTSNLRRENDELSAALREAECNLSNYELRVNELTEQSRVVDQQDFHTWLEAISLDNQRILTGPYEHRADDNGSTVAGVEGVKNASEESEYFLGKKIADYSVRDLVESLIGRWKAYVGNEPVPSTSGNSGSTPRVSKAEQRFMQRVVDLVMNANDRASEASTTMTQAVEQVKRYELLSRVTSERLHVCAQHLNRYRKRCLAYEMVINSDMKASVAKQTKLEAHLRKALSKERAKLAECTESLRAEHRDRQIIEIKKQLEGNQIRKMQAQLAELESRGSATLRGRDEAIASLENKLKNAHDSMVRWFKSELPRLVCGLPITENAVTSIFSDSMGGYGLDGSPSSMDAVFDHHQGDITKQMLANLGLDRTYSLSQALVVSHAAQANQNMRITGLNEKLAIYKERNLELEGVVMRWKEQINESLREQRLHSSVQEASHAHYLGDSGLLRLSKDNSISNLDAIIQQVYHNADVEKNLTAQITLLNNRLVEVEEDSIEAKGKFHHANARATELKTLVDTVLADEQVLKSKATQQLTKLRVDLENEHAGELRRQRHSAEADKRALIAELEKVSHAVEEAHLETVDPYAWQRLIKGTRQGGDVHIAGGHHVENSGAYEPLFFDSLHEDSPRSVEKEAAVLGNRRKTDKGGHKKSSKSRKHRKSGDDGSSRASSDTDARSSRSRSSSSDSESSDDSDQDELVRIGETNHRQQRSDKQVEKKKQSGDKKGDGKKRGKRSGGGKGHKDAGSATSSLSSHTDNRDGKHLKEIQVENLTRVLEIERRKTTEARNELEELEHIVSVQNSMLKAQQDSLLNNTMVNTTASTDPSPHHQPAVPPRDDFPAENEVRKEDQSLWPSLGSLVDELMMLLQSLSQRCAGSTTTADMARSALSMAARVKVACTSQPTDTLSQRPGSRPAHSQSAATTVTGAHTGDHHHREHQHQQYFDREDESTRRYRSELDNIRSTSSAALDSRGGVDVIGHFKTLTSRVKMIESDLLNDNIPERHLYLLRDLRMRVGEIESAMREEIEQQRAAWSEERASLLRVAQENFSLVEQLRQDQEGNVGIIRGRYEEALAHSQEALEQNTSVARMEIHRLEEELMRLQSIIASGGSHHGAADAHHRSHHSSSSAVAAHSHSHHDLENAKHQIDTMVTQHKSEINQLKTHFGKYQRAQGEIVRCLEDQLEEMQHGSFLSGASPFDNMAAEVNSIEEAADKIRRLEFKNRTKTMEMEAVMRALAKTIDGEYSTADVGDHYALPQSQSHQQHQHHTSSSGHHNQHHHRSHGHHDHRDHHQEDPNDDTYSTIEMPELLVKPMKPPSHPYDRSASGAEGIAMQRTGAPAARRPSGSAGGGSGAANAAGLTEVKEEIYEARLLAAETEIEALHRNLLKERNTSQDLRTAMQKMLEKRGEEMKELQELQQRVKSSGAAGVVASASSNQQPRTSEDVTANTAAPSGANAGDSAQQQQQQQPPLVVDRNSDRFVVNDAFLTDYAQEFSLPQDGPLFKDTVRKTLRRANVFRQSARVEVSRMKDHILHQENTMSQLRDEVLRQRTAVVEAKNTLVSLRDDNSRKTKLLQSLKAAKTADSNSLEQWKNEAKENDENVKRLQRNIQSKDALIKDMKTKIETLEEAAAQAAEHRPQSGSGAAFGSSSATAAGSTAVDQSGLTLDIGSLSLFELRTKLKASELERNRSRTRIQGLKDRVIELETEVKPLREEVEKLRKMNERSEGLKTALQRKEQQVAQLRRELDRSVMSESQLRQAVAESGDDAENRIKAMQRQIDTSLIESANRERETDLLRQRVYALQGEKNAEAGVRLAEGVDHQLASHGVGGVVPSSIGNQFAQFYHQPAAAAAAPHSHKAMVLPSSLGAAATHDLQDVITALGGTMPAAAATGAAPAGAAARGRPTTTVNTSSSSSSSDGSLNRPVTQRLFPTMGGTSHDTTSTSLSSVQDSSGVGGGAMSGVSSAQKSLEAKIAAMLNSPSRRK